MHYIPFGTISCPKFSNQRNLPAQNKWFLERLYMQLGKMCLTIQTDGPTRMGDSPPIKNHKSEGYTEKNIQSNW